MGPRVTSVIIFEKTVVMSVDKVSQESLAKVADHKTKLSKLLKFKQFYINFNVKLL